MFKFTYLLFMIVALINYSIFINVSLFISWLICSFGAILTHIIYNILTKKIINDKPIVLSKSDEVKSKKSIAKKNQLLVPYTVLKKLEETEDKKESTTKKKKVSSKKKTQSK